MFPSDLGASKKAPAPSPAPKDGLKTAKSSLSTVKKNDNQHFGSAGAPIQKGDKVTLNPPLPAKPSEKPNGLINNAIGALSKGGKNLPEKSKLPPVPTTLPPVVNNPISKAIPAIEKAIKKKTVPVVKPSTEKPGPSGSITIIKPITQPAQPEAPVIAPVSPAPAQPPEENKDKEKKDKKEDPKPVQIVPPVQLPAPVKPRFQPLTQPISFDSILANLPEPSSSTIKKSTAMPGVDLTMMPTTVRNSIERHGVIGVEQRIQRIMQRIKITQGLDDNYPLNQLQAEAVMQLLSDLGDPQASQIYLEVLNGDKADYTVLPDGDADHAKARQKDYYRHAMTLPT